MFAVKLALLLMLIGGLTRVSDSGMHIRGDIHMLLVGDPAPVCLAHAAASCHICCFLRWLSCHATKHCCALHFAWRMQGRHSLCYLPSGMSQLMKYASQLSPRTIMASGTGSSAAGLTATAVRCFPVISMDSHAPSISWSRQF